jgi:hypothetical protein
VVGGVFDFDSGGGWAIGQCCAFVVILRKDEVLVVDNRLTVDNQAHGVIVVMFMRIDLLEFLNLIWSFYVDI